LLGLAHDNLKGLTVVPAAEFVPHVSDTGGVIHANVVTDKPDRPIDHDGIDAILMV
jgi:hypothetical protein